MAYQQIKNIKIAGFAASVPKNIQENASLGIFKNPTEYQAFVATTGVERRRVAPKEMCASDLCLASAEKLISELGWQKNDIECLVFASHSPDYLSPATACILQNRLGLTQECLSFDMALGCSAWVYGLATVGSIVSAGKIRKALLLTGDTTTRTKSPNDKSTYPLFGDAGSATAIEYAESTTGLVAHLSTDGSNYKAVIMEDGGHRNPFSTDSLIEREYEEGIKHNRLQTHLDGMSVFSFGITKAPQSIRALLTKYSVSTEHVDYLVLHQANRFMNEKIRKKIGFTPENTPSILRNFGNTSSASIPLTIVSELRNIINEDDHKSLQILACGFGVGLSWGSVLFSLSDAVCCDLIEL